jgi:hypothetical protein
MNPGPTDGAEKSEPQPAAYGSISCRFWSVTTEWDNAWQRYFESWLGQMHR